MNNKEKLREKARALVPVAQVSGISLYQEFLARYSIFRHVTTDDWDYYYTIMSIFVATLGMENLKASRRFKSELAKIYGKIFKERMKRDWSDAYIDCEQFFWKKVEELMSLKTDFYDNNPKYRIADPIGIWMYNKLFRHTPKTESEMKLARKIGTIVADEFMAWWL